MNEGQIVYATQTRIIPAQSESAFDVTAAYVACVSASHTEFDASFNDAPAALFQPGIKIGGGGIAKTQKVSIRNKHATDALTVEIAYGIGQFEDGRLALPGDAVKVQPTATNTPFNVTPRAPAGSDAYGATVAGGGSSSGPLGLGADANRARAHVQNNGAGAVKLIASGTVWGIDIQPGEIFTVEGGAGFVVHNPNAFAVPMVTLLETWT